MDYVMIVHCDILTARAWEGDNIRAFPGGIEQVEWLLSNLESQDNT